MSVTLFCCLNNYLASFAKSSLHTDLIKIRSTCSTNETHQQIHVAFGTGIPLGRGGTYNYASETGSIG